MTMAYSVYMNLVISKTKEAKIQTNDFIRSKVFYSLCYNCFILKRLWSFTGSEFNWSKNVRLKQVSYFPHVGLDPVYYLKVI
jgi:hypothetical protein